MAIADHPTRDDIDLLAGWFYGGDPHDAWQWMRANAPVYWDGAHGVWGITRYEDVRAISKQPELFSNAGGIRPETPPLPMMIDMDDPEHLGRRKLVNRGFTPKRVRDQEAKIRTVCHWIIDQVAEQGSCDFVRDVAAPLPMIMIGDMLGVAPEDRATLLRWSDEMLCSLVGMDDAEVVVKAAEAFAAYGEYAGHVIERRRAEPTDDLMSVLCHAEVDGDRLSDEDIRHESLLILIGGDETTRHVLSGGLYQLVVDPARRDAVVADRSLLPGAVEEMLRWVSPIKNMCRTVTADVDLRGQRLEAGEKLMLFYPSANRDEDVFPDPFTFDLRRSPNDHLAFGGYGPHFCLGASLARLELTTMFDCLLERLPDIALAEPAEPANRPANFVSGYEELPVVFTPQPSLGTPVV